MVHNVSYNTSQIIHFIILHYELLDTTAYYTLISPYTTLHYVTIYYIAYRACLCLPRAGSPELLFATQDIACDVPRTGSAPWATLLHGCHAVSCTRGHELVAWRASQQMYAEKHRMWLLTPKGLKGGGGEWSVGISPAWQVLGLKEPILSLCTLNIRV